MSKQRTKQPKQPKQQTKQKPLYDHQHSALFDEMTADEALIAQSEATTQAWIKYNAKIAEGAVDEINELDKASKSETLASEEGLATTIEQLRASLEERDQLLREKDKQISDLTRDYRHVTEVNIQLEKRLQRLDEENEGLKQDKSDLRDTILILKQPQVEKILVIKQPEYDILKSQLDSIQKHENGQDSLLLGVDNSEVGEVVYNPETIG